MRYSISLPTKSDSWKVVKRAEELGFDGAWFFDTQLLNADPFVAMAAAAMRTESIRLATGVLIPSNRIAPVTANALASLNTLAPGRIDLGISTGYTGRRTLGLPAVKQAEMEEYIRIVRGLLARETVEWEFEGKRRKIRFLNPELNLINTTDPIGVYISALGPRGRALTARLDCGWINSVFAIDKAHEELADMKKAWAEAGRKPDELMAVAHTGGCILEEGEAYDSPRVKAQAGPSVSMVFHNLVEEELRPGRKMEAPPPLAPTLEKYKQFYASYQPADAKYLTNHRGHLMFLRPEEEPAITGDLIRNMTFTGPKAELRERIRAFRDAGYTEFSIRLTHEETVEDWADLIEGV